MYFLHNQFFTTIITEDNRFENVSYFKMHTICCKSLSEHEVKQILRNAGYNEYIWRRIKYWIYIREQRYEHYLHC